MQSRVAALAARAFVDECVNSNIERTICTKSIIHLMFAEMKRWK